MNGSRKRISRILALGHKAPDEMKRISRGEVYTCVDGTQEEHEALRSFCENLTKGLGSLGLHLEDLSPDELREFLVRNPPEVSEV